MGTFGEALGRRTAKHFNIRLRTGRVPAVQTMHRRDVKKPATFFLVRPAYASHVQRTRNRARLYSLCNLPLRRTNPRLPTTRSPGAQWLHR